MARAGARAWLTGQEVRPIGELHAIRSDVAFWKGEKKMNANNLELGEAFLNAFNEKDISRITTMVHPEIRLKSPMNDASNSESYLAVVRKLLSNIKGLRIKSKFASGNQAMFTYDINYNEPIGLVAAAILMTFEGGQVKDLEVFYDGRPFEKAQTGMKLAA